MEELLKKIKKTEIEAAKIITLAEEKAKNIIDSSHIEANKKLSEEKMLLIKKYQDIKNKNHTDAKNEKEKTIELKFKEHIQNLGDINNKKNKAIAYLSEKVTKQLL